MTCSNGRRRKRLSADGETRKQNPARARMDQVQVLSAVCKKLNNDIEALANQTSIRESTLAQLDSNQQAHDEQLRQLNMDLQIKLSKTDAVVQKLQSEVEQMSHGLRDVLNNQQETNRNGGQRYQELKLEVREPFSSLT